MKKILSLMILLSLSLNLSCLKALKLSQKGRKPVVNKQDQLVAVQEKLQELVSLIGVKEVDVQDPKTGKRTKSLESRNVTDTEKAVLKTLFEILYPQKYEFFDIEPSLTLPIGVTSAMIEMYRNLDLENFHLTTKVPFIVHIIEQLQLRVFKLIDQLIDLETRIDNIKNLTITILQNEHTFNNTDCRNNITDQKPECIDKVKKYNTALADSYCTLRKELDAAREKVKIHRAFLDSFEKSFFGAVDEEIIWMPSAENLDIAAEKKETAVLETIKNSFNRLQIYIENLQTDLEHTYNVNMKKMPRFYKLGDVESLKTKCPYLEQNWTKITKLPISCEKADGYEPDKTTDLCKCTAGYKLDALTKVCKEITLS